MLDKRSPAIKYLSWGRVQVEGAVSPYKDAKLFPGGSREWDWNETDTRHVPGVQPADVQELLERDARVIVLSTGMWNRLRVAAETTRLLEEKGIEYVILQTKEAVDR
ncbi:MAG TPA: MTH938/NDUFAF3 family protein, partial [Acidobacteriota bacterium]|nr:MTH938/NDUFAF3 family protein [Acidobacteriota bacterium]